MWLAVSFPRVAARPFPSGRTRPPLGHLDHARGNLIGHVASHGERYGLASGNPHRTSVCSWPRLRISQRWCETPPLSRRPVQFLDHFPALPRRHWPRGVPQQKRCCHLRQFSPRHGTGYSHRNRCCGCLTASAEPVGGLVRGNPPDGACRSLSHRRFPSCLPPPAI